MTNLLKIAKIKWQCRRGMLELDLLFHRFINNTQLVLDNEQIDALLDLLEAEDPLLYAWLIGNEPPLEKDKQIVKFIQLHTQA